MARGIEGSEIFRNDTDRADFVNRLARLASDDALAVYAWALMPNHVHLLIRSKARPLASSMRALLGGYATVHNRRHKRIGHLFQNRYKSILCDEEAYFLTLVQYIHLNPVRAGIVSRLADLDDYRWTGHSTIIGRISRPWQDTKSVLACLADSRPAAHRAYQDLISNGMHSPTAVDLDGGGLRRSTEGLEIVDRLVRGRERFRSDERILGRSEFTERILKELTYGAPKPDGCGVHLDALVEGVAGAVGIPSSLIWSRGRTRPQSLARQGLAYLWIFRLGRFGRELAAQIHVSPNAVYAAARRGKRQGDRWSAVLKGIVGDEVRTKVG